MKSSQTSWHYYSYTDGIYFSCILTKLKVDYFFTISEIILNNEHYKGVTGYVNLLNNEEYKRLTGNITLSDNDECIDFQIFYSNSRVPEFYYDLNIKKFKLSFQKLRRNLNADPQYVNKNFSITKEKKK